MQATTYDIGCQLGKAFRRMYRNVLQGYDPYSLSYVPERDLYVATFDVRWWDDEDIVDGSFAVYCTIHPSTGHVTVVDIDSVDGILCGQEGSVLERVPRSFESSIEHLYRARESQDNDIYTHAPDLHDVMFPV